MRKTPSASAQAPIMIDRLKPPRPGAATSSTPKITETTPATSNSHCAAPRTRLDSRSARSDERYRDALEHCIMERAMRDSHESRFAPHFRR